MDIRNAELFAVSKDILNAWTLTNTNTDVPSWNAANIDAADILIDSCNTHLSYLRNLGVGYSVPSKF
jgi:hypothetical protein